MKIKVRRPDALGLKRIKELEQGLTQMKRMYAGMALENRAMKDLIGQKH